MKLRAAITLALVPTLVACSSKNLSRSKAKDLIDADKRFAEPVSSVPIKDCKAVVTAATKDGIAKVVVESHHSSFGLPTYQTTSIELTAEGGKYFKKFSCEGFGPTLEIVAPLRRSVVEVTGIADAMGPGGVTSAGTKDVDFTWRFADVPDVVARYTKADTIKKSQATLRLYDDGWRVETLWNGEWLPQ